MIGRFRNALYNAIGNLEENGSSGSHHQANGSSDQSGGGGRRLTFTGDSPSTSGGSLRVKYPYQRPIFLQLFTDDEIQVKRES